MYSYTTTTLENGQHAVSYLLDVTQSLHHQMHKNKQLLVQKLSILYILEVMWLPEQQLLIHYARHISSAHKMTEEKVYVRCG